MKKPPPIFQDRLAAGTLIGDGKYRLVERLAAGGNGVVWLADHLALGQYVVAKFPICGKGNQRQQLETEMKLLTQFSNRHPNIVNILDVGFYKRSAFLVVQYLNNGTLSEYLYGRTRKKALAGKCLHENGNWVLAIAGALDFLHANQLLHLDVKPANILFDTSYSPYLSDFGIAISHSLDDSKNCDKKIVYGTMPYLAPEVFSGNAEPRSDQFSFAVTIWEFLIGRRPFKDRSPRKVGQGWKRVPFPIGCRESVGPELNIIFQKALSFDPRRRFDSCQAFAEEIVGHWPFNESEWQNLIVDAGKEKESRITRSVFQADNDTNPSSGIPLPETDSVRGPQSKPAGKRTVRLSRIMRHDPKSGKGDS